MIDREQAELLANHWARQESQRIGHRCTPLVEEFDFGYVIWQTVSPDAPTVPGDLPTTVIDRMTGIVTYWPRIPAQAVAAAYLRRRPEQPAPRTVDPAYQLLRQQRRRSTPGVVAHLTLGSQTYVAQGAKGDVSLNHHWFVRSHLDELPIGHLVRGGDRHAELIVVSDALHDVDHRRSQQGLPPLDHGDCLRLLSDSYLEAYWIRDKFDAAAGLAKSTCDSCSTLLSRMRIPTGITEAVTELHPHPQPVPDPNRFPPEVAYALANGGWGSSYQFEGETAEESISRAARRGNRIWGIHLEAFPAVHAAVNDFLMVFGARQGPGEQVWITPFCIDPQHGAASPRTLMDFRAVLGSRLFPIGWEPGTETLLVIDEQGRVFALDQAGEWFLGATLDEALITLILGRAPSRIRDNGTWETPPW